MAQEYAARIRREAEEEAAAIRREAQEEARISRFQDMLSEGVNAAAAESEAQSIREQAELQAARIRREAERQAEHKAASKASEAKQERVERFQKKMASPEAHEELPSVAAPRTKPSPQPQPAGHRNMARSKARARDKSRAEGDRLPRGPGWDGSPASRLDQSQLLEQRWPGPEGSTGSTRSDSTPSLSLQHGSVMPMQRSKSPAPTPKDFVPGSARPRLFPAPEAARAPPAGAREPQHSLVARTQPVALEPQRSSLFSKATSTQKLAPRLARIFDTYVRARQPARGATFDEISVANQRMDLAEFSQMAVDYGFVPELLSVEMLKAVFFEQASTGHDRAHLDQKQFELCIARMVDASVAACVHTPLPQGVMDLLAFLEASHTQPPKPAKPQIYDWEPESAAPPARIVGGARQRTPLRQRPGSPSRMLPSGKLARQRVLLLPNDGGVCKAPVAVIMHDALSLIEEATRKLALPWAARRFFTTEGAEVGALHQISPEAVLVVSTGDEFKPRKGGPRTRAVGRSPSNVPYQYPSASAAPLEGTTPDDNLKRTARASSGRKSPARRLNHVRRCPVRLNDGGAAPDRAVVQATSWQGLCDDAALQLGLAFAVTRLFSATGQEVSSIGQVASGMELVVSCGEEFVRRGGPRSVTELEAEVRASEDRLLSAKAQLERAKGGQQQQQQQRKPMRAAQASW